MPRPYVPNPDESYLIQSADEAAEFFNTPLTMNQWVDVQNYFVSGTIPEFDGCTSCDRYFVRQFISKIMQENQARVERKINYAIVGD